MKDTLTPDVTSLGKAMLKWVTVLQGGEAQVSNWSTHWSISGAPGVYDTPPSVTEVVNCWLVRVRAVNAHDASESAGTGVVRGL